MTFYYLILYHKLKYVTWLVESVHITLVQFFYVECDVWWCKKVFNIGDTLNIKCPYKTFGSSFLW